MLIRFQTENFLSFRQKQNIALIASSTRNKKEHIFEKNGVKLLNLTAIYGANASGKTNLIKAIDFFQFLVINSLPININNMYFREVKENISKPTSFEIEFTINDSVYAYGIQLLLNKRIIQAEWLYKLLAEKDSEEMIYERKLINHEYEFSYDKNLIHGQDSERFEFIISDLKENFTTLLLTEMNRNKVIKESSALFLFNEVYDWFANDLKVFFPDDPITRFDYVIGSDKTKNEVINQIISSFDTGISAVSLAKLARDEAGQIVPLEIIDEIVTNIRNDKTNKLKASSRKSVLRSDRDYLQISNITADGYDLETIKLSHGKEKITYDFREESDGTRRLFDLLDILLSSAENKVFVVDELDRSLHPNLTYKFIELFYQLAEKKNIQLIFTTHESKIMDLNLVRQDEIWFVERNKFNESILYSLDSFKERYDKRIEKAYLDGRYGAIPLFSSFGTFTNDENEA